MKFFKSTLAIIALLATSPMFAAKSTAAKQTPAGAAASVKTYSEMLAQIRKMPPAQVIDNKMNTLNPTFVKSIMDNASLSQTEAQALLQAGVNMHATWSGNDAENKAKLQNLNMQVAKNAPAVNAPAVEEGEYMDMPDLFAETPKALPQTPTKTPKTAKTLPTAPSFYDKNTNLLNEDILLALAFEQIQQGIPAIEVIQNILAKYANAMIPIWKNKNLGQMTQLTALNKQVNDAVEMIAKQMALKASLNPLVKEFSSGDLNKVAPTSKALPKTPTKTPKTLPTAPLRATLTPIVQTPEEQQAEKELQRLIQEEAPMQKPSATSMYQQSLRQQAAKDAMTAQDKYTAGMELTNAEKAELARSLE